VRVARRRRAWPSTSTDTGIGIDSDHHGVLFEEFHQVATRRRAPLRRHRPRPRPLAPHGPRHGRRHRGREPPGRGAPSPLPARAPPEGPRQCVLSRCARRRRVPAPACSSSTTWPPTASSTAPSSRTTGTTVHRGRRRRQRPGRPRSDGRTSTSCSSTSPCPAWTASRCSGASARAPTAAPPCSSSPPPRASPPPSSAASPTAPTRTSPSPSRTASSPPASAPPSRSTGCAASSRALRRDQTAMLVHDLRHPLANLSMLAEVIEADELNPRSAATPPATSAAWSTTSGASSTPCSRRRASRPGCSPSSPARRPRDLVARPSRCSAPSPSGAASRLEVAPLPDASPVRRPARVRQVLDNLLSNAVKFSPRGRRRARERAVDRRLRRVRVSDSGPGVPRPSAPSSSTATARPRRAHAGRRGPRARHRRGHRRRPRRHHPLRGRRTAAARISPSPSPSRAEGTPPRADARLT
jgi:hypothetical protein